MRIAIATSDEPKEWYEDIDLLLKALAENDATGEQIVWDTPNVQWSDYDVVFIDSTWNYTEKSEDFLHWCEQTAAVSKLVNSSEVIQLSSNKRYLTTLAEARLNVPDTSILTAASRIDTTLLTRYDKQIVVKPVIGADGIDTYLFNDLKTAATTTSFTNMLTTRDIVIQNYMPEIKTLGEIGAIFIVGQLSHCILKRPTGSDFRVQYQYGGKTTLTTAPEYTHNLYEKVTSALDVDPIYMRLDFIPTGNPTIMEVEMVEPNKYFSLYPKGAQMLAKALIS